VTDAAIHLFHYFGTINKVNAKIQKIIEMARYVYDCFRQFKPFSPFDFSLDCRIVLCTPRNDRRYSKSVFEVFLDCCAVLVMMKKLLHLIVMIFLWIATQTCNSERNKIADMTASLKFF
jgi:hypothetical protein